VARALLGLHRVTTGQPRPADHGGERYITDEDVLVFVVDGDPLIRESLQCLIRSAGLCVQTFGSAHDFLSSERPDTPACLVLDVELPGLSGLDLQRELAEAGILLPIIFITGHGEIRTSVRAMKAGAVDFLTKPFCPQELLEAVWRAIERDRTARRERVAMLDLRRRLDLLTPRERQVMGLVVAGLLNKQIAAELGTSEVTIKVHRARLMQKMRAESLPALVRMAEKLGIRPAEKQSCYTNG
jgi:FixJ family two-component response regulator